MRGKEMETLLGPDKVALLNFAVVTWVLAK